MDHRLFDAAKGDISALELLFQEDPLLLDRLSQSSLENPLHVAAFSGQADFTAKILSLKPGLALEENQRGFSPLHIASASGELEVVRELLKVWNHDVICLLKDREDFIPLHYAAQRGRMDVMKELVSSFPDSLMEVTASLETPLHVAVKNNQVEATRLLLEEIKTRKMAHAQGILNQENREGNTVLHLATLGKQLQARLFKSFRQLKQRTQETNAETLKPIRPSKLPCRMIRNFLHYEISNSTLEQRETLMIVAALIATLTFTGILQPPGAFKSEDASGGGSGPQNNNTTSTTGLSRIIDNVFGPRNSTAGQAVMASRTIYFTLYASFNAIGFLVSVAMISLLTKGFPLRNWMRLCIISIVATYLIAIVYIAPDEDVFWVVVLGVSSILVLRELYLFFKSLIKGFSTAKSLYFSS
ncbi:unnamed protein product [Microthlaspi erraticum]|uniref:PGG domain-containing protein n=1 Tax=Microthlaspi erraticum TaxID=1685480 RepID=A0A6D2KNJ0_9BRAS|nr:unnamed protein product [Microthlaspi erraticum]